VTKKNHAKQSSNGRAGRVAAWAVARPRRRTGLLLTLVVALSIMLVMGFGLLPLTAGGGLRCDPPLRGATGRPKPNMPPVIQENVKSMCNEAAGSRWATVGVGVLVLFVVATAAVVTPADRFEKVLLHREANPLEAT
jgi:hypothetical protein